MLSEKIHNPLIPLFVESIRGVRKMQNEELRNAVFQASKTFEHHQMSVFALAAEKLSEQKDWGDGDTVRAQCMALYHMYLMFYRDSGCHVRDRFLRIITTRYLRATKNTK